MLNEDKKSIIDKNYFLNKRHDARKKNKFLRTKHRLFLFSIFLALVCIGLFYFLTDFSNIYKINVKNNIYYKEADILNKANINTDNKFLLVNSKAIEKRLKEDPLIKECEVIKSDGKLITIDIKEEKAYGYALEDNKNVLLLLNDGRLEINEDNTYLIEKVPLIEGFTTEQLQKIAKGFESVEPEIIDEISEIHRYPFSYDENMMEVIMRDGNYVFVSSFGLKLLDRYYAISSGLELTSSGACIYLDEVTNSGYTSNCPREEPVVTNPVEDNNNVDDDINNIDDDNVEE